MKRNAYINALENRFMLYFSTHPALSSMAHDLYYPEIKSRNFEELVEQWVYVWNGMGIETVKGERTMVYMYPAGTPNRCPAFVAMHSGPVPAFNVKTMWKHYTYSIYYVEAGKYEVARSSKKSWLRRKAEGISLFS